MKIQKFKGELKGTTDTIYGLQLYEEDGELRLIKNLSWRDGYDYTAETYDLDEFDRLIEYFDEYDESDKNIRGPDWIIKAQTSK